MSSTQGQKDGRDKYSLRGRVFQSIREDILSGRYEQNTELKEAAIGAELGVSRTPVREALRQLELEGLVTIIPNRGAYVNMITAKDVQDIYVIHNTYGVIRAELHLCNRREVKQFIESIHTGREAALHGLCKGGHWHTVSADTENALDLIAQELRARGYLIERTGGSESGNADGGKRG